MRTCTITWQAAQLHLETQRSVGIASAVWMREEAQYKGNTYRTPFDVPLYRLPRVMNPRGEQQSVVVSVEEKLFFAVFPAISAPSPASS